MVFNALQINSSVFSEKTGAKAKKSVWSTKGQHNSEVLQHFIVAKKPYELRLRGAAPALYIILVRKPHKLGPRYGLST